MYRADTAESEVPAKRNALICPCCLQFVEGNVSFLADPTTYKVTNGDKTVKLTEQLFKLAKYLIDKYPLVAAKNDIYDRVFIQPNGEGPAMKIMDVRICQLRPQLAEVGLVIETVWGVGWKLIEAPAMEANAIKGLSVRLRGPGSAQRWSTEHDAQLLDLIGRNMRVAQCAAIMKMPYMAVERAYKRLQEVA